MKADTKPCADSQFRITGYVLTEDQKMFLTDMFAAMEATAFAYDMDQGGTANFDLYGDQVAAVLRSFARLGKATLRDAPIAYDAVARKLEE